MSLSLVGNLSQTLTKYLSEGDYELCVNEPGRVWIDRPGVVGMHCIDAPDVDRYFLDMFAQAVAGANDLTISDDLPVLSSTLPDSSDRIEIIRPPACHPDQFILALRRNVVGRIGYDQYKQQDYFSKTRIIQTRKQGAETDIENDSVFALADKGDAWGAVKEAVVLGRSIVVCGKFSSGKTVMSSSLLSLIPMHSRIGIIEDVFELDLPHQNVLRLSSANDPKQPHRNGHSLMRSLMRLTPDRIIVGELRDGLVVQYLKSANVACDGNISTLHSDTPHHAIQRLVELYLEEKPTMQPEFVQQMICSAIDLMVFIRHDNGERYCSSIYFPKFELTI